MSRGSPATRLLPQPYGFEGLSGIEVLLGAGDPAISEVQDEGVLLVERGAAARALGDDPVEEDDPIAEIDHLPGLRPIIAPSAEPLAVEADVAVVASVAPADDVRFGHSAR